ncbi:Lar family restriction alleviation protein [Xenorhabdus vietnamensis]|uniref:Lar family restriction alleviation protein n=1 Tax=Xenorhabdus vietnamensis TaxID=351656 RepID=UPI000A31E9D6
MAETDELKPCPVCLSDKLTMIQTSRSDFRNYIACDKCKHQTGICRNEQSAIKVWNGSRNQRARNALPPQSK